MQMQLPFFFSKVKLINFSLGFYQDNGLVYYLHNGSPIFCHKKDDVRSYRYISGNLIINGLCRIKELSGVFDVNKCNIERY